MPTFRIGGLASGIDTDNIIKEMLELKRLPLQRLETRKTTLEERRGAWRDVRARLFNLQNQAADLRRIATWNGRKAAVADQQVVSASASSEAVPGSHTLQVLSLAQAHVVAGGAFQDRSGALNITGTFKVGPDETDISVGTGDSLLSIRDKINGARVGVTARVVQIGSGDNPLYRLVLTAENTGTANAIRLTDGTARQVTSVTIVAADTPQPATVQVQTSSDTVAGFYELSVEQRAQAHRLAGDWVPSAQTFVGDFEINGKTVSVNGDIDHVASQINSVSAGVAASVEVNGGDRRLMLDAEASGTANAIRLADPDGVLQDLGVVQADATTAKQVEQMAADAVFRFNGLKYRRGYNTGITDAVPGLSLDLLAAGGMTFRVLPDASGGDDNVLQALGLWNRAGQVADEVAQAQDATFQLDGLTFTRAENQVNDAVDGLRLTLAQAGTTTITVAKDAARAVAAVRGFVDQYNSAVAFLAEKTAYNAQDQVAEVLFGDGAAHLLQRDLWRQATGAVAGLPADFNALSRVGVTGGRWDSAQRGKLVLDEAVLLAKLEEDPEGVARLFGALRLNVGSAANAATATASSQAGSDFAPDGVINGNTGAGRWGSVGGGWQSATVPSPANEEWLEISFDKSRTIDQVNVHMLNSEDYPAATHSLKDYKLQYWTGTTWATLREVENNTSGLNRLEFGAVTTTKIRLLVTGTHANEKAKVVEVEALQRADGVAERVHRLAAQQTRAVTGMLTARERAFDNQIKGVDDRLSLMRERLKRHEEALQRKFVALERALAELRNQGSALGAQLASLQTNVGKS